MPDLLRDVKILGVHPVAASDELLAETLELQWGPDLEGEDLRSAGEHVREHFAGLYLIELQFHPSGAEVDWSEFAQPRADEPESDWQVAYDEQAVDEAAGKWAFFLHNVELTRPLQTPAGPRALPKPSQRPRHLAHIEYEAP